MKQETYTSFISRPEISFWLPIITSLITITISWTNLSGRVDLLSQKSDLILQNQANILTSMQATDLDLAAKYTQMQTQWGQLSQRVSKLER